MSDLKSRRLIFLHQSIDDSQLAVSNSECSIESSFTVLLFVLVFCLRFSLVELDFDRFDFYCVFSFCALSRNIDRGKVGPKKLV